ncbi:FkbM family methyltransferase [bacterium]|nr:FkbM family methyltransferase [bacterium]
MKNWLNAVRRKWIDVGLRVLLLYNRLLTWLGFKHVYYAEFFTDRALRSQFFPDFSYRGVMVEVGCATPMLLSMSQHFRQNGWRCIGIEPNPSFVKLHQQSGNEVYAYAAADFDQDDVDFVVVESSQDYSASSLSAHSYSALAIKDQYQNYQNEAINSFRKREIKVRVRRLSAILSQHCPEVGFIDLLSVDVEGFELEVIRGLNLERHPVRVIVLENLFYDNKYTEYMESRGYRLHSQVRYNFIYTRRN